VETFVKFYAEKSSVITSAGNCRVLLRHNHNSKQQHMRTVIVLPANNWMYEENSHGRTNKFERPRPSTDLTSEIEHSLAFSDCVTQKLSTGLKSDISFESVLVRRWKAI